MRNIFLEKSYTEFDEKTIPRPFSKKSKLSIWIQSLKLYIVFFIVCLFLRIFQEFFISFDKFNRFYEKSNLMKRLEFYE